MKIVKVVAAIIREDGKILATQRGYGELKGGWEFPGGKIEPGETQEEALVREIKEELDVTVSVGDLCAEVEYDYVKFHLSMKCYWCKIVAGEVKLVEHMDARYLSAEDIDSVEWLPADVAVVEKLKKELGKKQD